MTRISYVDLKSLEPGQVKRNVVSETKDTNTIRIHDDKDDELYVEVRPLTGEPGAFALVGSGAVTIEVLASNRFILKVTK